LTHVMRDTQLPDQPEMLSDVIPDWRMRFYRRAISVWLGLCTGWATFCGAAAVMMELDIRVESPNPLMATVFFGTVVLVAIGTAITAYKFIRPKWWITAAVVAPIIAFGTHLWALNLVTQWVVEQ
jgi:hypothetical protein